MGKDDGYYNYEHYYDAIKFEVSSETPSHIAIGLAILFTALIIASGFFVKIKKKKWQTDTTSDNVTKEDEEVIPSSFMCGTASNDVFDFALMDDEHDCDNASINSMGSEEAYEYFETLFLGFEQNKDFRKKKPKEKIFMNAVNIEQGITYKENKCAPRKEIIHSPPMAEAVEESFLDNYTDNVVSQKLKQKRRLSLFGRRRFSMQFTLNIKEKLKRSKKETIEDNCMHYTSFDQIQQTPISAEIQMLEIPTSHMNHSNESYDSFIEGGIDAIEKNFDPDLNIKVEKIEKKIDQETEENTDASLKDEMAQVWKLTIPWSISSIISYASSIVALALISSFLSVAEMICYSYVWFITGAAFLPVDAIYSSLYKHVNNAISNGDVNGYVKAGKYMKISCLIIIALSIPISIGVVFGMGSIFEWYGFEQHMIELSKHYTIVAVIHTVFSTLFSIISVSTDLEGNANFNAKFSTVESIIDILLSAFVIPIFHPSLVQLGLIHICEEIFGYAVYFYLTGYKWGWYDHYLSGIKAPLENNRENKKALATLVKKSFPLALDAVNSNLEWFTFSFFASYVGETEAACWVLLSYIYDIIGVVPYYLAESAEYRISSLLSTGNIFIARSIADRVMLLSFLWSLVDTAILFAAKLPLIRILTSDFDLAFMLDKAMPLVLLCHPVFTLSSTAGFYNHALAMFKRSSKISFLVNAFVIIPLGAVSTFVYGYDISGLLIASNVGHAVNGFIVLVVYNNADWEKGVRKNKKMAGKIDSSKAKLTGKIDSSSKVNLNTSDYDDCYWDELDPKAKEAAETLGYDKDRWDNDMELDEFCEYNDFDFDELPAYVQEAILYLGYTQDSWNED